MDAKQTDIIRGLDDSETVTVHIDEISDQNDRTLLYGYTVDRDTFHVYIQDGEIHRLIYAYGGEPISHISGSELAATDLQPNKRAYPEWTDFEFALLLKTRGVDPNLTNYSTPSPALIDAKAQFAPFVGQIA